MLDCLLKVKSIIKNISKATLPASSSLSYICLELYTTIWREPI